MSNPLFRRIRFGSSQDRRIYPSYFALDRLGNQSKRYEARKPPHLGPGCYDNNEFRSIVYNLETRPESYKGYALSARTGTRFTPFKLTKPSPQQYQRDQSKSRVPFHGRAPFGSYEYKFKLPKNTALNNPSPGMYEHITKTNRKVIWPMCFGKPDWSKLPQLEKKTVKVTEPANYMFVKHRGRLAYLSLYF
ncbi:protein pitchfork [Poecilia latipinna]|uniref:protein pitchfork n=1 Tax=Poecilia formosa TaxID=48698 RepID=UPI00044450DE|nr:PREDICTED: protein pitchfork [Poecilia formosa]XP_014899757.1 PREDICTED: protein pitchfork [Poecilia latipinna]